MKSHVDRICDLVDARIDAEPAKTARRLLRPQLRWVAQELDGQLAEQLGVLALIESCRDEHLASLDADDGLTVLGIGWEDVVLRLRERDESREPVRRHPTRRRRWY
jgi:hypothetical protein